MKMILALLLLLGLMLILVPISPDVQSLKPNTIQVTVKGEVVIPGIYELASYSTLKDLLEIVQLTAEADIDHLNENQILFHHDIVTIAKRTEINRISINTGSLEQLMLLPGIGEKTALEIISYREVNGLFQSIEEITKVKGIGASKFEKIKDLITL